MSDDERAIRAVIETWMRASAAGDTQTVLGLMTDDVMFLVPGRKPFGKEAFAASSPGMKGMKVEGKSTVREIRVNGDWAWCVTDLVVDMSPAGGGQSVRRSGNTLSIFQRLPDGRWLLARDANMLTVEKTGA